MCTLAVNTACRICRIRRIDHAAPFPLKFFSPSSLLWCIFSSLVSIASGGHVISCHAMKYVLSCVYAVVGHMWPSNHCSKGPSSRNVRPPHALVEISVQNRPVLLVCQVQQLFAVASIDSKCGVLIDRARLERLYHSSAHAVCECNVKQRKVLPPRGLWWYCVFLPPNIRREYHTSPGWVLLLCANRFACKVPSAKMTSRAPCP